MTVQRSVREWFDDGTGQLSLLALAAVCLAVEGYYLAVVPPATGFETSIYEPYPLAFWLSFHLCTALVVVVLLSSATSGRSYYGRALTILSANYGILLFLPTFRGYQLQDAGTGDLLVHLGHVRGILETGEVPGVWYPFEHVLVALIGVFGVPLKESGILFTWVFLVAFVATTGLFVRSLTRHRFGLVAGSAAAIPILMGTFVRGALPAIFSLFLFPALLLFVDRFRRTVDRRYLGLLCLTAIAVVFFHPLTAVLMVLLLASTAAFGHLYGKVSERQVRVTGWNVALASVPVMFVWYAGFGKTWFMLETILTDLFGGSPSPTGSTVSESVELTTVQIAIRFVQLYGAVFVYLIIAALFTIIVVYSVVWRRAKYPETYLTMQFGIGFVLAAVFMAFPLEAMMPIRNSRYMILMAVFLTAVVLVWTVSTDVRWGRAVAVVLAIAIVVSAVLSVGMVYKPNGHLTESTFEGVDHTIEYHDPSVDVHALKLNTNVDRYVRSTQSQAVPPYYFESDGTFIPPRLGYGENETAAETFGGAYLVTREYDTEFYTASYFFPRQQANMFVYDESDTERLRGDPTVDRMYDNGGFEGWRVNASVGGE